MLIATQEYLELIAEALTDMTGIKVVPEEGKSVWHSDVKNKIIYYPRANLTQFPFPVIRGLLSHEVGHVLYTSPDKDMEKRETVKKYGIKQMMLVYNVLEDPRIERKIGTKWSGFCDRAIDVSNNYLINLTYERLDYELAKMSKLNEFLFLMATDCYKTLTGVHNPFEGVALRRNISIVSDNSYYGYYQEKNIKMRKDVLKRYTDNIDEIRNMYRDAELASTTFQVEEIADKRLVPIIKDYLEEEKKNKSNAAMPRPINMHTLKSEPAAAHRRTGLPDELFDYSLPTEREAISLLRPYINTLAQRLKDILKERTTRRVTGSYRRGTLLSKNTYKVLLNEERIFSKKINPNEPKHNVFIGLDRSGSMGQDRVYWCFMGGILIQEVSKRLRFPVNAYSYGTNPHRLPGGAGTYRGGGSDNCEYKLFNMIADDIKREGKQNDDNLVFIITDGGTERDTVFIEGEKRMKAAGATLYGVGIGDSSVQQMIKKVYKNGIYSPKLEDLSLNIINLFRRIIKR